MGQASSSQRRVGATAARAMLVALVLGAVALWWVAGRAGGPGVPEVTADASLWLVLLTGLSVGGLSCLAVQGGLLAALIAGRETRLQGTAAGQRERLLPIGQFLAGKLAAYTLLGALLGAFGSRIPLGAQGWLMVAVGLFMLLVVLQLYDAHPLLRRLTFSPPKSVQRLVRRESRRADALGPSLVGALTVFVPCGVTLAMQFLAVTSDSALRGAAIMAVFTLGTMPTFLLVGAAASQVGRSAFALFKPLAAAAVAVIGVTTIISGMRLLGVGVVLPGGVPTAASVAEIERPAAALDRSPAVAPSSGGRTQLQQSAVQEAVVQVSTGVYTPSRVVVRPNVPTRLTLVTSDTKGCIRAFVIPSLGVERLLPATGSEVVELPPAAPGQTIPFMCSMGMYTGVIQVSES